MPEIYALARFFHLPKNILPNTRSVIILATMASITVVKFSSMPNEIWPANRISEIKMGAEYLLRR
jgi:hypothetical protein